MGRGLACSVAIGLLLLPACNQVLGLERAQLQSDGGTLFTSGVPKRGSACEEAPGATCSECLAGSCDRAEQECAADPDCRVELDRYAVCLHPQCDGDPEICAIDNITDRGLLRCLSTCAGACQRRNPLSPCELYCGCMANFCTDEMAQIDDCLATCEALPAEVRDCRRDHCEWGLGDTVHCQHASDRLHVCESLAERAENDRSICTEGKESTWACDRSSECCSSLCVDGACK